MTAVTLSPHQLANLQQQHRDLPAANNPSRLSPQCPHADRAGSSRRPGRANERSGPVETSVGAMENQQHNSSERPGLEDSPEKGAQGRAQLRRVDLNDRSNSNQTSIVHRSNPSSEHQDDETHEQSILEHRSARSKTGLSNEEAEMSVPYALAAPQRSHDFHTISHAETNGHGRPEKPLLRAKSDLGPRGPSPTAVGSNAEEENWELRHGWEDQYNSNEYLSILTSVSKNLASASSYMSRATKRSYCISTDFNMNRRSICITLTSVMRPAEYPKRRLIHCRSGGCETV